VSAASIAAVLLVASAACASQQPVLSHLTITIVDKSGAVVPGATVIVTDSDTKAQTQKVADANGMAEFDVPVGSYQLDMLHSGFKTLRILHIDLANGLSQSVTGQLEIADQGCSVPCRWIWQADIPTQSLTISEAIPSLPLAQLPLRSNPSRRRFL
jgi:hypothetical protein